MFYEKGCEYCHAINGQRGIRGPALTHIADRMTEGQMVAIIAKGIGNMPGYVNIISPGQMNALVAYLSTQTEQPSPPKAER